MVYLKNLTSSAMIAICFFGWWAPAHGAELEEAQLAANEGRYSDVVNLLTGVLEEKEGQCTSSVKNLIFMEDMELLELRFL